MLRTSNLRSIYSALKKIRSSSTVSPTYPGTVENSNPTTSDQARPFSNDRVSNSKKLKSTMVAAVFDSLKNPDNKAETTDERILDCTTPEELLTLSHKTSVNKKQALKIVTTLAEWSVNGNADMSKIETDPRFVSLCQLLGRSSNGTEKYRTTEQPKQTIKDKHGDLSIVENISKNNQAAKLVSTFTESQMIEVLSSLAVQRKRSLPLLKTLASNIADLQNRIDIKKSADILYALSVLNFPDEVVLEKISNDLIETIPCCEKSAVIGSICTSLGRLRYRDDRVLDCLSEWIITHENLCRSQEFVSILITLAIVNHLPPSSKFFDLITSKLSDEDLPSTTWLDVVWSLVTLGKATSEHYQSVLSQRFVQRILSSHGDNSSSAWKKKLLNVNGAAKYCNEYKGPVLENDSEVNVVPLVRSKEKQLMVNSVLDAISNILPSAAYLRNNIDSGMGFLIDGECRFDAKMTPYPLVDKKTRLPIIYKPGKSQKVAIMCWDYHDNTRGKVGLTGANVLNIDLLSKAGYRVLSINYNEYNTKDKLSDRIVYIQENLKKTIKPLS
ncbi:hypothetical protein O3M35_001034 [Rhynocoris fuscipes]|uniref:RAP domain-containing protein n=1 Tax=Rhynocoris fuscipes TaxID=488301 RepID=A0AAW1DNW5_9HEMI